MLCSCIEDGEGAGEVVYTRVVVSRTVGASVLAPWGGGRGSSSFHPKEMELFA